MISDNLSLFISAVSSVIGKTPDPNSIEGWKVPFPLPKTIETLSLFIFAVTKSKLQSQLK